MYRQRHIVLRRRRSPLFTRAIVSDLEDRSGTWTDVLQNLQISPHGPAATPRTFSMSKPQNKDTTTAHKPPRMNPTQRVPPCTPSLSTAQACKCSLRSSLRHWRSAKTTAQSMPLQPSNPRPESHSPITSGKLGSETLPTHPFHCGV